MPSYYLDKGKWKEKITSVWSKDNSKWNDLVNRYHKVNGEWCPIYKYEWKTGNWGACSKVCDTGTQTRAVDCYRSGKKIDNKSLCTKALNNTPPSSQNCNTHSCLSTVTLTSLQSDDHVEPIGQVNPSNYDQIVQSGTTVGRKDGCGPTNVVLSYRLDYVSGGYIYYKFKIIDTEDVILGLGIWTAKGCGEQVQGNLIRGYVNGSCRGDCWYARYVSGRYEQYQVVFKIPV